MPVQEAELSMLRRLDADQDCILVVQSTLAGTYQALGRGEDAMRVQKDVYSGRLRLDGEEHGRTLEAANNYAHCLLCLQRFEETRSLLRKTMPAARRVFGESHEVTLKMKKIYADALCLDAGATLDDNREAVTTLEDVERTARRVFGGAHPFIAHIQRGLRQARALLAAREAQRS